MDTKTMILPEPMVDFSVENANAMVRDPDITKQLVIDPYNNTFIFDIMGVQRREGVTFHRQFSGDLINSNQLHSPDTTEKEKEEVPHEVAKRYTLEHFGHKTGDISFRGKADDIGISAIRSDHVISPWSMIENKENLLYQHRERREYVLDGQTQYSTITGGPEAFHIPHELIPVNDIQTYLLTSKVSLHNNIDFSNVAQFAQNIGVDPRRLCGLIAFAQFLIHEIVNGLYPKLFITTMDSIMGPNINEYKSLIPKEQIPDWDNKLQYITELLRQISNEMYYLKDPAGRVSFDGRLKLTIGNVYTNIWFIDKVSQVNFTINVRTLNNNFTDESSAFLKEEDIYDGYSLSHALKYCETDSFGRIYSEPSYSQASTYNNFTGGRHI